MRAQPCCEAPGRARRTPGYFKKPLPCVGYEPDSYSLTPVQPTRRLVDGDDIDLGDRALKVLHLPGHTQGSIGLFDREHGTLFTGDVIYDPPAILDDLIGSDAAAYASSMRRLLTLDVDIVHTGHGESFDRSRLHELIHEYLHPNASPVE